MVRIVFCRGRSFGTAINLFLPEGRERERPKEVKPKKARVS
jgi:hypothetical protein